MQGMVVRRTEHDPVVNICEVAAGEEDHVMGVASRGPFSTAFRDASIAVPGNDRSSLGCGE